MTKLALLHFVITAALLVSVAGCVQPLDSVSEIPAVQDVSSFYWQRAALAQGVHYRIQGDTVEEHTLTSGDGLRINDVSGYSTGTLVIRANRDSIIVDSISTHTIFLLPPGFAFGSNPAVTLLSIKAVIETSSGRIVVATDSGVYLSDDRTSWIHAYGVIGSVAALAVDSSSGQLYAGCGDSLMVSTNGGSAWSRTAVPRPGVAILSLAASSDANLYVGYAGSGGVDRRDSGSGSFSPFASSQRDVISIAVADSSRRHFVGIATDELAEIYNDTGRVKLSLPSYNTSEIRALSGSDMLVTAGAAITKVYLPAMRPAAITIQSGAEMLTTGLMYKSQYFAGGTGGTIFGTDGYTKTQSPLQTPITSMIHSRQGDLIVATTDGLWSFNGSSATHLKSGPYMDRPKDAAPGLLLLTRVQNSLTRGDSWSAGNLYINAVRTSVPITARVIDRVDTLYSSAVHAWFGESFVVRYAFETGGNIDPTLPVYWLVYYSRNAGPTIIEEYLSSGGSYALKSRASMVAY
jgi:hypothetical protein